MKPTITPLAAFLLALLLPISALACFAYADGGLSFSGELLRVSNNSNIDKNSIEGDTLALSVSITEPFELNTFQNNEYFSDGQYALYCEGFLTIGGLAQSFTATGKIDTMTQHSAMGSARGYLTGSNAISDLITLSIAIDKTTGDMIVNLTKGAVTGREIPEHYKFGVQTAQVTADLKARMEALEQRAKSHVPPEIVYAENQPEFHVIGQSERLSSTVQLGAEFAFIVTALFILALIMP